MTSAAPTLAREMTRGPWLSAAFVTVALLATNVGGLGEALAFRRAAFEAGEIWRALTLHFVHPWPQLALADLGVLLLLGSVLEQRSRSRLVAIWFAAGLLASTTVVLWRPDLHSYQGSSALVAGMWTAVAVDCLTSSNRSRVAGGLLLLLWAGKTACELAGTWPMALGILPIGVEGVAEAHLAGGLGGGSVAALSALAMPRSGKK